MPYILNKTNGNVLLTLEDSSVDISTSLTFVGKNYSGYGESVNENFLKLLENFSNSSQPAKPILGQLWFNSNSDKRRLEVCYDGKNFKGIATLRVQESSPTSNLQGDLWWDSTNKQLKAYDGSGYVLVGPVTSKSSRSSWVFDEEKGTDNTDIVTYPVMKAKVGGITLLTIAKLGAQSKTFVPDAGSDIYSDINQDAVVKKGITLVGADKTTGSSRSSDYYFWGTAAESLTSVTATNALRLISTVTRNNSDFYVPFVDAIGQSGQIFTTSTFSINPNTNVLKTTATAARYADLAEKYLADSNYSVGTVMAVGGTAEITACKRGDRAIGVVSANPAFIMNEALDNGILVALKGRVPVKVEGIIKKGDRLTAGNNGRARSTVLGDPEVFAIALYDANMGMVEAVIL